MDNHFTQHESIAVRFDCLGYPDVLRSGRLGASERLVRLHGYRLRALRGTQYRFGALYRMRLVQLNSEVSRTYAYKK